MVAFLAGAATFGYLIGAFFFLRFWRRTADRLFLAFAVAFVLFAINQTVAQAVGNSYEQISYVYLLRIVGFALIALAIVDKNLYK